MYTIKINVIGQLHGLRIISYFVIYTTCARQQQIKRITASYLELQKTENRRNFKIV